jgi:uncharacterized membrane protein
MQMQTETASTKKIVMMILMETTLQLDVYKLVLVDRSLTLILGTVFKYVLKDGMGILINA